ncbi:hypothetical protein FQR65_LT02922 [Abscondita terminalis]|nr:hypothetical protein FQR65_LT02922 [Abscondita terminalis]
MHCSFRKDKFKKILFTNDVDCAGNFIRDLFTVKIRFVRMKCSCATVIRRLVGNP